MESHMAEAKAKRPNRTAKARREQQMRSDARAMTRLLQGLSSIQLHRGNQLSHIGFALQSLIRDEQRSATTSHHTTCPQYGSRMPICRHAIAGRCTWGVQCRFSHRGLTQPCADDDDNVYDDNADHNSTYEDEVLQRSVGESVPTRVVKAEGEADEGARGSETDTEGLRLTEEPKAEKETTIEDDAAQETEEEPRTENKLDVDADPLTRVLGDPVASASDPSSLEVDDHHAMHHHNVMYDHHASPDSSDESDDDVDDESDTEPITWSHVESAVRKVVHNHGAQIQLHDLRGLVEAELQIPHNALRECLRELKTMLLQARREADT